MKIIQKFTLALILLTSLRVAAQLPMGGDMDRLKKEINKVGGKINQKEALAIVDKLLKEKILNQAGRDAFKNYISDKKTLDIFEKKPKIDSAAAEGGRGQAVLGMLKGADSLTLNRASFLFLLGVIDLHRSTYETMRLMNVPLPKMKPILGEKWSFKPILDGDIQNPLSFKLNMADYRDNYNGLLESINRTGLLDPKVYADCQQWLKKEQVFILKDFSLFLYAGMRSIYYDSYPALQKSQGWQIDSLQLAGLLTKDATNQLKSSIKDFKLLYKTDILKSIPNTITLRTGTTLGFQQRKDALQRLFEQVPRLIPNLKISNLQIKEVAMTEEQPMNGLLGAMMGGVGKFLDRSMVEISADLNGKRYVKQVPLTKASEEAVPDSSMQNTINRLIGSAWLGAKDLQLLNDFLIDSGSNKRLFVAGDELTIFPGPNREKRVVMLLDSTQQVILKEQFKFTIGFGFGEGSDFEGINSLKNLKSVYTNLLETKLISPLNDVQLEKMLLESRKSVTRDGIEDNIVYELLNQKNRFVKGNLYDKEQKPETYRDFLGKMKAVSNNSFNPIDIQDNFQTEFAKPKEETKDLRFSFKIGENLFEDSLKIESGNEDNAFALMMGLSPYGDLENKIGGLIYKATAETNLKPYSFNKGTEKHYLFLNDDEFTILADKFPAKFTSTEVYAATVDTVAYAPSFNSEQFISELTEMSLIDDTGKAEIAKTYEYGLSSPMDATPFLKERIDFDINEYAKKSEKELLTDLYQKTRERFLKDLKFDYFRIKKDSIKIDTDGNTYYDVFTGVEYGMGNNKYRDKFYGIESTLAFIKEELERGANPDSIYNETLNIPYGFFNAYLMDSENPKRILSYVVSSQKVSILGLTEEQAQKVEQYGLFGTANRMALLEDIKKLENMKLIPPMVDFDDFLMKYREGLPDLNVMSELFLANSMAFATYEWSGETAWKDALEKASGKTVLLDKFTSNFGAVQKKTEEQIAIEDEEKKVAAIDYKGEFTVKGKKIPYAFKLEKDTGYYFDIYMLNESIIKPINAQLDATKSLKKYYVSDSYIFFINQAQKEFLEEKGLSFIE